MIARTKHSPKLAILLALLVAGFALLLSRPAAQTSGSGPVETVLRNAQTVADQAANPTFVIADQDVDGDSLIRFYAMRGQRLAWSGGAREAADAALALSALSSTADHGLETARYHLDRLANTGSAEDRDGTAVRDLLLTDAMLAYARDLRNGQASPTAVDRDVALPVERPDMVSALNAALDAGTFDAFLDGLAPAHPEYTRLKTALQRYRKLADEGGWPELPAIARSQDAEAEGYARLLRQRLAIEDEAAGGEADLLESLRRYQRRNGLEPDGKIGARTLAALNVPAFTRVRQIVANMERWRWLPRALEARRIMVNAADATLELIEDNKVVLRSKVIVGTTAQRSPMFRTLATGVTVNPPWTVPNSIARNEILPRLRRDPNYLRSQNMIVLDGPRDDPNGLRIDWSRIPAGTFPYRLQQRPGANNALGRLKLEMPNPFSVYLHDTPGKRAFQGTDRALSHGCIRVEQILALASVALGGDATGALQALAGATATEETKYFAFAQSLPVYVLYWTATVDADGTVQFRRDVYGRDERLIRVLRTGATDSSTFYTGDCRNTTG
jgi:murein L,D-transpeptidase YcbB/YkuD